MKSCAGLSDHDVAVDCHGPERLLAADAGPDEASRSIRAIRMAEKSQTGTSSEPRLYLLHGMKRSGNHALVNWLQPQIGFRFFNNIIPIAPILRGEAKLPRPIDFRQWVVAAGVAQRHLLASLEDHDLRLSPFLNVDLPCQRLLIVRHPDNLFSSRIHKAFSVENPAYPRETGPLMQRVLSLWKQHVRAYLNSTDEYAGRVAIYFDAWFENVEYRQAISARLGVDFDDSGLSRVSGLGGGSSFDGTQWHGNTSKMAVNKRLDLLDERERTLLEELYRDPEMQDLRDALAGSDPFQRL
jgi:hypothetical protein